MELMLLHHRTSAQTLGVTLGKPVPVNDQRLTKYAALNAD